MKKIINENTNSRMTYAEKVQAIHDWMIKNIEYDHSFKEHKASAGLNKHIVVCSGYAYLFNAFMDLMNIPCKYISGTVHKESGDGDHAWNAVQLEDGFWYFIDVTWDDQNIDNRSDYKDGSNLTYEYFLISRQTMNKDHTTTTVLSPETKYDYNRNYYNKLSANIEMKRLYTYYTNMGYDTFMIDNYNTLTKVLQNASLNNYYVLLIDTTSVSTKTVQKQVKSYARNKLKRKRHAETHERDIVDIMFFYIY